ncbi:MAG: N-acetylmuramoyl-L-alanine amidase [Helicobacteraceae bacterium]|jgi:N-acetylmuramoyl-L-alanine amidase|nr:N-acetylmuramoyl-L-alanine amidase [Helicobacteraceae bacterium]
MGKINKLFFALFCFIFCAFAANAQSIISYNLTRDKLVVEFEENITESDYRSFYLKPENKGEPYRRGLDIQTKFSKNYFEDRFAAIARVKIAQYDTKITRIVFADEKYFTLNIKINDSTMIIEIISDSEKDKKPLDKFGGHKPIVMIDAGHGGYDTGAKGMKGFLEKDVVLKIALLTKNALARLGYEVKITRENDTYVTLQDRTSEANKVNADLFVSIHANACPRPCKLQGIETYFLSPAKSDRAKDVAALENGVVENMEEYSKRTFLNFLNREMVVSSNKLAIDVQRSMLYYTREVFSKTLDGGVREGPFWVLVGAQMPAVLVEVGYITHKDEINRITDEAYQQAIADGIALGIDNYFLNNWVKR